jgi:hypothetical protein
VARVQYLPMMTARTPTSLALLDRFHLLATELLGGPVVPLRAKGIRYFGATPWHRDSTLPLASIGFAAFEPLSEQTGALQVVPGSHREVSGGGGRPPRQAVALATEPGDVIVLDEHILHASSGGTVRRQWRVDYFRDPGDAAEEEVVRDYLERVLGGSGPLPYDAARFPSYGPDWTASGRPAVERLRRLGALDLASGK